MATEGFNVRPKKIASPNREKFASLVSKLDPHQPDFAEQVATENVRMEAREQMTTKLCLLLKECRGGLASRLGGVSKGHFDGADDLLEALYVAVERFVVDRY